MSADAIRHFFAGRRHPRFNPYPRGSGDNFHISIRCKQCGAGLRLNDADEYIEFGKALELAQDTPTVCSRRNAR